MFRNAGASVETTCDLLEGLTLNVVDSAGGSINRKVQPAVITKDIKQGKKSDSDVILPTNPIGYLQEFCQKYKNSPEEFPKYYYFRSDKGGFTSKCIFDGYKAYFTSSEQSKKSGKTKVARKMLLTLINDNYFDKYGVFTFKKSMGNNLFLGQPADPFTPNALKNPISVIHEYCQAKGCKDPEFTITSFTGNPSAPTEFTCQCKVAGHTIYGVGANKNCAKTDAARNMCRRLGLQFEGDKIYRTEKIVSTLDINKNAVSALQEFCDARNALPAPQYGSKGVDMNFFITVCNVGEVSAEGRHTTRKGAKESAAKKVLIKLKTLEAE